MGEPLAEPSVQDTRAESASTGVTLNPEGAAGATPPTWTVMVPVTARDSEPVESSTLYCAVMVPWNPLLGVIVTVVPEALIEPWPEVIVGVPDRVIGLSGKGLLTALDTSVLTASPLRDSRLIGAVVMRGLLEALTRTGREALTGGLTPSETVIGMEPVVPSAVLSEALTDSVEPLREISNPAGAGPAWKESLSFGSGSVAMAARLAVTAPSPGATVISVGVKVGGRFVEDSTMIGSVSVELRASEPVPSATVKVTEVCPVKPESGVKDSADPPEATLASLVPLAMWMEEVSVMTGLVPSRVRM